MYDHPDSQKIHPSQFPDQSHPFDCRWRRSRHAAKPKPEFAPTKPPLKPAQAAAATGAHDQRLALNR